MIMLIHAWSLASTTRISPACDHASFYLAAYVDNLPEGIPAEAVSHRMRVIIREMRHVPFIVRSLNVPSDAIRPSKGPSVRVWKQIKGAFESCDCRKRKNNTEKNIKWLALFLKWLK